MRKVYNAYFEVKLGDQNKLWAPRIVCKACVESLRKWTKGRLTIISLHHLWFGEIGENQNSISVIAASVW